MQKWEYCQVTHGRGGVWVIAYYRSSGLDKRDHRHNPGEHQDEKARIFARLGEEGWEYAGDGIFKRPVP